MEKTCKENKRTWRIRQWYFPIFSLYANPYKLEPISEIFQPIQQSQDTIDHLSMKGGMVEKTISSYCPLNLGSCLSVLNGGIVAACHRQLGTL